MNLKSRLVFLALGLCSASVMAKTPNLGCSITQDSREFALAYCAMPLGCHGASGLVSGNKHDWLDGPACSAMVSELRGQGYSANDLAVDLFNEGNRALCEGNNILGKLVGCAMMASSVMVDAVKFEKCYEKYKTACVGGSSSRRSASSGSSGRRSSSRSGSRRYNSGAWKAKKHFAYANMSDGGVFGVRFEEETPIASLCNNKFKGDPYVQIRINVDVGDYFQDWKFKKSPISSSCFLYEIPDSSELLHTLKNGNSVNLVFDGVHERTLDLSGSKQALWKAWDYEDN